MRRSSLPLRLATSSTPRRLLAAFVALGPLAACGVEAAPRGASGDDAPGAPAGSAGAADEAAAAAGGGAAEPAAGASPSAPAKPFVHADVNHVLLTGQSNSVANGARPLRSTTQPYANLMFDVGVMTGTGAGGAGACDGTGCRGYEKPSSFVPLVEGDRYFGPGEEVETSASGFANQATKLARETYLAGRAGKEADHVVLASVHGRSGNTYWCLSKNGCSYKEGYTRAFEEGVQQMHDAHALAAAGGKSHVVRGVWAVHGESDSDSICVDGEPDYNLAWPDACPGYYGPNGEFPLPATGGAGEVRSYEEALLEWQRDYDAAAKGVTGQTTDVPLFISQYSGWKDTPRSKLPAMQLAAHVRSGGRVILVGPTYMLPVQADALHFTAESEQWLGEMFGKAYAATVLGGRPFEPLRPTGAARAGARVTVTFLVPKPPLVFDVVRVTDPGQYGFEVVDATGVEIPLAAVTLAGPDSVTLDLARDPGGPVNVRYAMRMARGTSPGPKYGARGNLRDSDTPPSQTGHDLANWAVHFELPVP